MKLSDCRVKCSQALTSSQEIKSRQSVVDSSIEKSREELEKFKELKAKSDENLESLQSRIDENNNSMQGYKSSLKIKMPMQIRLKQNLKK